MTLVQKATHSKRCAIYTRKSSERGLQQDFNSLKAQHAICSAYIQSQQHKGWIEIADVYEDAAQSGATLDRPAMKELLADVEKGRIDVVVVYTSWIGLAGAYWTSYVCWMRSNDMVSRSHASPRTSTQATAWADW